MEKNGQFARLLHQSFEQQFPSWKMLPDFDPVKLIAGSVTRALSEIEVQQESVLDTVLDSLPTILGFEAKPACLPRALVTMEPASSLENEVELSTDLTFRMDEQGKSFVLHPIAGTKLQPYTQFRQTLTGNTLKTIFQVKGKNSKLVLHFVPQDSKTGSVCHVADFRLVVSSIRAKRVREFHFTDMLVHDGTANFSRRGTITLELLPSRGVLLYDDFSEIDLTLVFDQMPAGSFFANLMECEFSQRVESVRLAPLHGKAWEVIPLPPEAIAAPEEIVLQYPDLSSENLSLWTGDLLIARRADPAGFQQSFFHHSPKHALIIPGAHRLMKDFAGAVEVRAKALTTIPTASLTENSALSYNPKPSWIASVRFQSNSQPAVPRESEAAYFQRVYTTLRQMPWQPTPGIFATNLEAALLSAHEDVRQVEIEVNNAQKSITIYSESGTPSLPSPQARDAMASVLNSTVPLDHHWQMAPFAAEPLKLIASLSVAVGADQTEKFDETVLSQIIRHVIVDNFHSNRFPRTSVLTRQLVHQRILSELAARLRDLKVHAFELHLMNPQSGQFLEYLSRPIGTHFAVELDLALSFARDEAVGYSSNLARPAPPAHLGGGVHA